MISIDDYGRNFCQSRLQYHCAQNTELFGHCINGKFDKSEQNRVLQHEIYQDLPNLLQQVHSTFANNYKTWNVKKLSD